MEKTIPDILGFGGGGGARISALMIRRYSRQQQAATTTISVTYLSGPSSTVHT